MQDIQWLFLGWFAKFLLCCAIGMLVLHQGAKAWRKRRQQHAPRPKDIRPAGLSVARR